MDHTSSAWPSHPDYKIDIKVLDKRISVAVNGVTVADSESVLLLDEQDHNPIYYFPIDDVQMLLFHKTDKVTFCPFKGKANHWALLIEQINIEVAAWGYPVPYEQVSKIKNHIAFYPALYDIAK